MYCTLMQSIHFFFTFFEYGHKKKQFPLFKENKHTENVTEKYKTK